MKYKIGHIIIPDDDDTVFELPNGAIPLKIDPKIGFKKSPGGTTIIYHVGLRITYLTPIKQVV